MKHQQSATGVARTWRHAAAAGAALLGLVLLSVACGEGVPVVSGGGGRARRAPSASASASASAAPKLQFLENEFTESEQSRDPFRSFPELFKENPEDAAAAQRAVLLGEYSIAELKLRAIVMNANPSVAMLVDPTGKGHTVHRGQYIGRAETVQSPGTAGTTYEVNWRIDRIRSGSIVLVRDDPRNPDVPSATKVLELRPGGEEVTLATSDTSSSEKPSLTKADIEAEVQRRLKQVKPPTAPTVIIRQNAPTAPAPAPAQNGASSPGAVGAGSPFGN